MTAIPRGTLTRFDLSGLAMSAVTEYDSAGLVRVTAPQPGTTAKAAVLGREAQRAAGWWLVCAAGEDREPYESDAVRVAVDEARAALRKRLRDGQLDDGLTALAWFENELDRIAEAAGAATTRRRALR